MLDARRIDHIRRVIEEGDTPHIGAETEGLVTDAASLEVIHRLGAEQPTRAVKRWVREHGERAGARASAVIIPDVPETTVEANPPPLRSPRSSAAAQRLLAIIVDSGLRGSGGNEARPQLLHGAAWRPPNLSLDDASRHVGWFKRFYYEFQIERHGDKVGAAAGDHLNLSAPWLGHPAKAEISRKMIEMTGRMRLIAGALSIGLSASSPLYFGADRGRPPTYGTVLTPWESARLGHVWPGRTIMDVSGLYRDPVSFRRTMDRFADSGTLLAGRDVWLTARAQPEPVGPRIPFRDLMTELGLDMASEEGRQRARQLLHASFEYGPRDIENGLGDDPAWQRLEAWRQELLSRIIRAPRNRIEIRTLETPPCFPDDGNGGEARTPYEYIKGVHSFLELLFIYLSETPELVEELEYGELELQAAKANEQAVLLGGLDAHIRWIPRNMRSFTARELLRRMLKELEPLADGLDRAADLQIIQRVADGETHAPAARIRREVAAWYGIDAGLRHNAQLLPDDEYPRQLLARWRTGMEDELDQIEADLPSLPAMDRVYLAELLDLAKTLRRMAHQTVAISSSSSSTS